MHTYIDSQEACNALHVTSGPLHLCSGVLMQLFSGTGSPKAGEATLIKSVLGLGRVMVREVRSF